MESNVADILNRKKIQRVWTVRPRASVVEALKLMALRNVGGLVVVEGEDIVGIVTERDYSRKVVLERRMPHTTLVEEIMTTDVMYVTPEDKVSGCMALMVEKHIRHLPVIDKGELVGIISIGDVVKFVIADQDFMIEQLTRYVTDSYTATVPRSIPLDDQIDMRVITT